MRSSLRPLLPRLCAALFRRPPIPMRRLACLTGFAAAIALPGAILIATLPSCLGPATTQPGGPGSGREPLPAGSYPEQPLAVGTKVPEFATAGWLNGPPPQPGPDGPRIIVLDIWADWWIACRQTAPGLVQVQHKYQDRGVAFVSLTAEPVATATGFVEHCHIGWSCGYGVALEDIAQWGAYSTARMSRSFNPGYEVSPTLFLIGPDQQVLWCDGQVRPRHAEHAEDLIHRLDDAIETALKGLPAASH